MDPQTPPLPNADSEPVAEEPLPEESAEPVATQAAATEPTAPVRRPSLPRRVATAIGGAFDDAAGGVAHFARSGLDYLWLHLVGFLGLGVGAWFLLHRDRLGDILTNKVNFHDQLAALRLVVGSLGVLTGVVFVTLIVRWLVTGRMQTERTLRRIGAIAVWFAVVPFAVAMFAPGIETTRPFLALFLALTGGLLAGVGVYRWGVLAKAPSDAARSPRRETIARAAAAVALVVLFAAYAVFFSRLAITNHHGLATRTTDLGYYDNIFYQSIHGNFLGCSFIKAEYHGSAHFDPILVLLSPLYLLYPRAELILVLQCVWVASTVFPVYLLGRAHALTRPTAFMLAAVFAFHPAVHGANLYEFHSLTLACMPLSWLLYFLETNRVRAYAITLFFALLVREDISLMACFIGLSALIRFDDRRRRLGLVTILASLIYFVIVKKFFMISENLLVAGPEAYSYAYYYEELANNGNGFGGMLLSLVTNPIFAISHVLEETKVLFIGKMFVPLFFLPFFAKKARILLVYGLAFCLLASRTAVFSTHFQYTASILPFAFATTPYAIARIRDGGVLEKLGLAREPFIRGLCCAMLVTSVLVSMRFGGVVDNQSFRGGFNRVVRHLGDAERATYAWVDETARSIPEEAVVGVTDKMGPHVSNRRYAYFYGDPKRPFDYIFVDERELRGDKDRRLKDDVTQGRFEEVSRMGTMVLLKRRQGAPPATTPSATPSAAPPPAPQPTAPPSTDQK